MVSWTHPEKAVSRLNSDALVTQLPSNSLQKPELGVRIEASYDKQNLSTAEDI